MDKQTFCSSQTTSNTSRYAAALYRRGTRDGPGQDGEALPRMLDAVEPGPWGWRTVRGLDSAISRDFRLAMPNPVGMGSGPLSSRGTASPAFEVRDRILRCYSHDQQSLA